MRVVRQVRHCVATSYDDLGHRLATRQGWRTRARGGGDGATTIRVCKAIGYMLNDINESHTPHAKGGGRGGAGGGCWPGASKHFGGGMLK